MYQSTDGLVYEKNATSTKSSSAAANPMTQSATPSEYETDERPHNRGLTSGMVPDSPSSYQFPGGRPIRGRPVSQGVHAGGSVMPRRLGASVASRAVGRHRRSGVRDVGLRRHAGRAIERAGPRVAEF